MIENIVAYAFTIFAVICGLAGLAALAFGLKTFVQENRNCTYRTMGRVIEVLYDYDLNHPEEPDLTEAGRVSCGLRLEVQIHDETFEVFNGTYSSDYCKYEEGDYVPVRINPGDPNEYVIDDGKTSPGLFVLLVGIGLLAVCGYIMKLFWL